MDQLTTEMKVNNLPDESGKEYGRIRTDVGRDRTLLSFEDEFQVFEFGVKKNQTFYEETERLR